MSRLDTGCGERWRERVDGRDAEREARRMWKRYKVRGRDKDSYGTHAKFSAGWSRMFN
jgi:hypothetical protein